MVLMSKKYHNSWYKQFYEKFKLLVTRINGYLLSNKQKTLKLLNEWVYKNLKFTIQSVN